jgi:hypothetical protein
MNLSEPEYGGGKMLNRRSKSSSVTPERRQPSERESGRLGRGQTRANAWKGGYRGGSRKALGS